MIDNENRTRFDFYCSFHEMTFISAFHCDKHFHNESIQGNLNNKHISNGTIEMFLRCNFSTETLNAFNLRNTAKL